MSVVEAPLTASDQELVRDLDGQLDLYVSVRGSTHPIPDILKGTTSGPSGCTESCEPTDR